MATAMVVLWVAATLPRKVAAQVLAVVVIAKVVVEMADPTVLRLSSLGGLIKNRSFFLFFFPCFIFVQHFCSIDLTV